ncbi:uncharacterized protein [Pagrus major]|uniref:uncharacterized protein isoform X2 n=1 Tax=Pagrus major TaxID=143350 RepID=UPI003CC85441
MRAQMQPLFYITFTVLCSLSFLSFGLSMQCNKTQYPWPPEQPTFCCYSCPPGTHLFGRREDCKIDCKPCGDKFFSDAYNVERTCNFCANCEKPNMEYESKCNATHNAVCRCKDGYQCREQPCLECEPIPSTTTPITPTSTTALKPTTNPATPPTPSKPLGDTVWFLVITALLTAVILLVVLTNSKPFLRWIRCLNLFPKPPAPVTQDGDVSQPVQEAGSVTNLKTDPELGLSLISQTDIQ